MRSILTLSALATLILAAPMPAQHVPSDGPCTAPAGPSPERLQAFARQYHPETLSPANNQASLLVGLVLDADCRLLHHATGRRAADSINVEATLGTLFPGVRTTPFVVAGITDAGPEADQSPGRPWIVWAVVKS